MTNLKDKIRALTPNQLASRGILQASPDGNYICPMCGNGAGEDGTGVEFSPTDDGTFVSKCFKCGEGFDIIDVLAKHFNLPIGQELFYKVATEFGLADENHRKSYADKISAANKNLYNFVQDHGGTFRGLPFDLLNSFNCGYSPQHCGYDGKSGKYFRVPRFIIPTSDFHFLGRLLCTAEELQKFGAPAHTPEKQHWGTKEIFNLKALQKATEEDTFFCVEGEFDAMSIIHAGFNAFALSGSEISDTRNSPVNQKKQLKSLANKPRIIVLFDNDATGKQNSTKVAAQLRKLGFYTATAFLPTTAKTADFEVKPIKDANDFLQIDADGLKNALNEICVKCKDKFKQDEAQDDFRTEERKVIITSRQVFPDCPVDVAIPAGFFVKRAGVFKFFKTPGHDPELVCSAPVFIGKRFVNPDGDNVKVQVYYLQRPNNVWKNFTCSMSDLYDPRTFGRNFVCRGIMMTMKGASRLGSYFADMLSDVENEHRIEVLDFFTQTGWLQDEFKKFVLPTDQEGSFPFLHETFDFGKAFKAHGSKKKSAEILRTLLKSSTTSRLTLGAVACAPLIRPLGIRNAQLHLCAGSGSGKTANIKAAMSLWGNPSMLRQTFKNSVNFIDEWPSNFNDLPVWIDEFQSLSKQMRRNVENQVYSYELGITRGRLDQYANVKPQKTFFGVKVTSGEEPITQYTTGQGAKNRIIELDFADILPNKFAIEMHKMFSTGDKASYGHFGRPYLEWLSDARNMEKVQDLFYKKCAELRLLGAVMNGYRGSVDDDVIAGLSDEVVGLLPSHVTMIAAFLTAAQTLVNAVFSHDTELVKEIDQRLTEDAYKMVTECHESKLSSAAERALPVILETVNTQSTRFERQTPQGRILPSILTPTLGRILSDGRVAFYAMQFKNLLDELGFSNPTDILRGLSKVGALDEGNCSKHKFKKYVTFTTETGEEKGAWMYVFVKDAETLVERRLDQDVAEVAAG